jgi:hypothetical protein
MLSYPTMPCNPTGRFFAPADGRVWIFVFMQVGPAAYFRMCTHVKKCKVRQDKILPCSRGAAA